MIRLYGKSKEVTLEKLRKMGVRPEKVEYSDGDICLLLSHQDYMRIADCEAELEFRVEKRTGGAFLFFDIKKRSMLVGFVISVFLLFFVGSRFIWTIEICGVESDKTEEIKAAAGLAGVRVGALKSHLGEPLELKNTILANTEDIAWCWVYIKGTRAVIDVRENILPPSIFDPDVPCDIVAAKDGLIRKVITKRGVCQVPDGTFVTRGDTLISGRVRFGEAGEYITHAKGVCEADTYYEREGIYKLYLNHKVYTGKCRRKLSLKLFGLTLPLHFSEEPDFKFYDTEKKMYEISFPKENYLGIGLEKVSYIEYNIIKEPISQEVCAEIARDELEREISGELMPGSVKKKSEISVDKIDEETVSVKLCMEFTEQIGTEKIIEEVTIFEPKTD